MSDTLFPRPRGFPLVVLVLGVFVAGVVVGDFGLLWPHSGRQPAGLGRTFAPFWEAWRLVKKYYVDPESATDVRMTRGAITGMLASLGDEGHTSYLSPEEVKRMQDSLSGRLEGIGATLTIRRRQPTILQTLPKSPARRAGLKPGDVLLAVDDKPVAGLSLQQIVDLVRGPAGTVVRLHVLSAGTGTPREVSVKRARVEVPEVSWGLLPGAPVAHVAIRAFGSNADSQLRAALKEIRSRQGKALIIDVRGNPGGLKEQAVAVTSEFLRAGQVVFIQVDSRGNQEKVLAEAGGRAGDLPVCVLIDGGTASSAEIFAGALKDHRRARLVGTRTFGTGTVLRPFDLSDGSAILLAVDKWLTPEGREIWHKGIAPDVEVTMPDDAAILLPDSTEKLTEEAFRKSQDKQLHKAYDLLREELAKKLGAKP
jgi:carboxyl-terminal processing protease